VQDNIPPREPRKANLLSVTQPGITEACRLYRRLQNASRAVSDGLWWVDRPMHIRTGKGHFVI
jgi:hypothetical protein